MNARAGSVVDARCGVVARATRERREMVVEKKARARRGVDDGVDGARDDPGARCVRGVESVLFWVTPFLRRGVEANKGARGQLEMDDLLQPPSAFVAKNNAEAFERAMLERLGGRGGAAARRAAETPRG